MKITAFIEFKPGEQVFLKTDKDKMRIVTAIIISGNQEIKYEISFCETSSIHYDCELERWKK